MQPETPMVRRGGGNSAGRADVDLGGGSTRIAVLIDSRNRKRTPILRIVAEDRKRRTGKEARRDEMDGF